MSQAKSANGKKKLSDFKPQRRNANRGNQAGLRELDKSIRRDGYSAPMVAAADGEIFAGSKRLERVADVYGVDVEPIIVHSDGKHPVIHIRDDIATADDPRAVRLGVADNVIAHLDFDPDGELLALLAAEDAAIAEMVKADWISARAALMDEDAQEQIGGLPETDNEDLLSLSVKVFFVSENNRKKFLHLVDYKNRVGDTKGRCISMWWPKVPDKAKDQLGNGLVYTNES